MRKRVFNRTEVSLWVLPVGQMASRLTLNSFVNRGAHSRLKNCKVPGNIAAQQALNCRYEVFVHICYYLTNMLCMMSKHLHFVIFCATSQMMWVNTYLCICFGCPGNAELDTGWDISHDARQSLVGSSYIWGCRENRRHRTNHRLWSAACKRL